MASISSLKNNNCGSIVIIVLIFFFQTSQLLMVFQAPMKKTFFKKVVKVTKLANNIVKKLLNKEIRIFPVLDICSLCVSNSSVVLKSLVSLSFIFKTSCACKLAI